MSGLHKAVFLDRDGVLNAAHVDRGRPHPPERIDDVVLLPGVNDACRRLADAGWLLIVVTNQPDVARGSCTREHVDAINDLVVATLPIAEVVVCPHDDDDGCECRKPLPGMLVDAARRWNVDLGASVLVGDRWRDVEAGRRAGARTIFVDHGYDELLPNPPDVTVTSLAEAADLLLDDVTASRGDGARDDWDHHWSEYADAASDNPAQAYRRQLVTTLIEREGTPARLVDIGSGQGDLLAALHERWPTTELVGVELSGEGIRHASAKVPGARFFQLDLSPPAAGGPPALESWAEVAVCSEVLEHVENPVAVLKAATRFIEPGGRLIVTVPGGPRTAFDRHIGHRRHYRPAALRQLLWEADLDVELVNGTGFPFFNLYKLVVLLRGKGLVQDITASAEPSALATSAMRAFATLLQPTRNSARRGWQLVAVARRR